MRLIFFSSERLRRRVVQASGKWSGELSGTELMLFFGDEAEGGTLRFKFGRTEESVRC